MKKIFIISLFIFSPLLNSIEISLEENKAESGTVGYVDIGTIFKKYSINSKKNFDKLILEKQNIVDSKKKELNYYTALKEKLNSEYQLAKISEDFYRSMADAAMTVSSSTSSDAVAISSNNISSTEITLSTPAPDIKISSGNVSVSTSQVKASSADLSTTTVSNNYIIKSTQTQSGDVPRAVSQSSVTISTTPSVQSPLPQSVQPSNIQTASVVKSTEEPYIVMPGIGKLPISNFKFSVSSSTAEIDKAIKDADSRISKLQDDIIKLKAKFDDELSKNASKENEKMLKKIYEAIDEVAKEEEVSVVVDKRNILFGRKTVDLTDRVLEKLRGN